jgi:2-polyprenyl-6-hydroxyphenyl methylase/3-demethylubiquinone-9 3-methyltransferase
MNNNVDQQEVEKFTKLADRWWDTEGPLKTLHSVNPLRIQWMMHQANLDDKHILDIGCGGGILTEALAKFSPNVVGIDRAKDCLDVAILHAKSMENPPTYQYISAEEFAKKNPASFDIISCLECLEHVPEPQSILTACSILLKPGGDLFLSTLNRTAKAFVQAIIGAEYILKMIPKGTHRYKEFIKPSELIQWMNKLPFRLQSMKGITYNPGTKQFLLCDDVSVNYLMHLKRV